MAQDNVKGLLSTGEVVLIDTRQHWAALVRFALKPILLLGLVILLALINSWLPRGGFVLDILTNLIHIVLVVSIIAAIVWIPVDVVRWMSRHYVLTNRRAMRMDGVFRKRSFDSSLEQINDISFSQTVVGRALGYSDLTLLTASDSANETYAQLMDGLQFKKALLDAKEAIRVGAPLQDLVEGFIVKGGTNLASMRADGKLQEAAAVAESGNGPPVEPVSAEVLAQRSDPGRATESAESSPPPAAATSADTTSPGTEALAAREADDAWPAADQASDTAAWADEGGDDEAESEADEGASDEDSTAADAEADDAEASTDAEADEDSPKTA